MTTDRWLTRLVGLTLAIIAVVLTVVASTLVLREVPVPDPLDRLLTFVLGALVGRLTTSKADSELVAVDVVPTPEA